MVSTFQLSICFCIDYLICSICLVKAPLYPPPERNIHPAPAYVMNNPAMESTVYTHNQPHILADEFPEQPGQPECSYFLKTGDCKFKSNCKYHHPKNQISKSLPCALSDKGLPLRPVSVLCFLSSASYGCYMCLGNNFEDHSHVGSKIKMEVLEQIQWFWRSFSCRGHSGIPSVSINLAGFIFHHAIKICQIFISLE